MSVLTESQAGLLSRRRFFRWISGISAALGAAPLVSSAETPSSPSALVRWRGLLCEARSPHDYQCRRHLYHFNRCVHAATGAGRRAEGRAPSCPAA